MFENRNPTTQRSLVLFSLSALVVLNFLLRFPITPHELGNDSFFIHNLAQIIVSNGYANWILSPLSFFGLYPFSYASGLPHLLAISSILTGIDVEWTIYFVSLLFGLFSILTAFLMAGEIKDNLYFKLIVAFIFSISPLLIKYTSWTVSARGFVLVLTPLFIWSLIKTGKTGSWKYSILSIIIFLTAISVHKIGFLFIPIVIATVCAKFFSDREKWFKARHFPLFFTVLISGLFFSQFFIISDYWTQEYQYNLSKFVLLNLSPQLNHFFGVLFLLAARYGIMLFFTLVGFFYLVFCEDLTLAKRIILFSSIIFIPLVVQSEYVLEFALPFIAIFAAYGFVYIFSSDSYVSKVLQRYQKYLIVAFLVLLVGFSLFSINVRYTNQYDIGYANYMYDTTYSMTAFLEEKLGPVWITGQSVPIRQIAAFTENRISESGNIDYILYDRIHPEKMRIGFKGFPTTFAGAIHFLKNPWRYDVSADTVNAQYVIGNSQLSINRSDIHFEKIYSNSLDEIWYDRG